MRQLTWDTNYIRVVEVTRRLPSIADCARWIIKTSLTRTSLSIPIKSTWFLSGPLLPLILCSVFSTTAVLLLSGALRYQYTHNQVAAGL